MKVTNLLILFITVFPMCACSMFGAKRSEPPPVVHTPKPLSIPVGKNWQVIEEAPKLSDERGRLPFQTEQSVQPEVAKPLAPGENRIIETPR